MRIVETGSQKALPGPLQSALSLHLSDRWECYVRPYFSGEKPDLVLLRPDAGVLIADFVALSPAMVASLPTSADDAEQWRTDDSVLQRAFARLVTHHEAAQAMLDRPSSSLGSVRTGLILVDSIDEDVPHRMQLAWEVIARQTVGRGRESRFHLHPKAHFFISTQGVADRDTLRDVLMMLQDQQSSETRSFSEREARRLRPHLELPDVVARQLKPLEMNREQRDLATQRNPEGRRRIQGAAGCGKSVVLAARAAQLAHEGQEVLLLSFNKTLWHYLRNLFDRHLNSLNGGSVQGFALDRLEATFDHFHGFLKRTSGLTLSTAQSYKDIPKYVSSTRPGEKVLPPRTEAMVSVALHALQMVGPQYDAIIVDEGQDWEAAWVPVLNAALRPGGELLVAEDLTQDIYRRAATHRDKQARFGVRARRMSSVSYRIPPRLADILQGYCTDFLEGDVDQPQSVPEPRLGELILNSYLVEPGADFVERTVEAVVHAHENLSQTLAFSDIYVVCQNNRPLGVEVVYALKSLGLQVIETFTGGREDFWEQDFPIKASTAHSIKGWESRAVIAVFPELNYSGQRQGLYIAMSRVLYHPDGSLLTVITRDEQFAGFAVANGFSAPALPSLERKPERAGTPGADEI
jgi:hypothetical protein